VLQGTRVGGSVGLDPKTARPGPLQRLSERLITAAGRGDAEAVAQLVDAGHVSVDVADSTGLTAVLAASVRIIGTRSCDVRIFLFF